MEKFEKDFKDFSDKYGFNDMYSGGFYPYSTEEERWAYWSRYVYINRYLEKTPNKAYAKLYELIKDKDYFVITTNVDHQFQIAGFNKNRLFYTQGDYGLFQCSVPCHDKTYDNKELIEKMYNEQRDGKIPSKLIPKCPICGRNMEMNLRADDRFVQDEGWYMHARLYQEFLDRIKGKNVVLLEIGVGYNTPSIIKFPFERMTYQNAHFNLIRINKDYPMAGEEIVKKTICFDEDTMKTLEDLI